MARGRTETRWSDPGEAPSPVGRALVGCGVGCGALLLLAAAIGIGVGAHRRMTGWGGHDDPASTPEPRPTEPRPTEPRPTEPTTPSPATTPQRPPRSVDDMRRRYRPGPHVRIESMVPSGRLLPSTTPGTVAAGRTVDNPWIVPGAELAPSAMPAASPGGPRVWNRDDSPLTVVARTPAEVGVSARDASGGTNVMAYLIELDGYRGHFRLPATTPTELGVVSAAGSDGATIHFAILSAIRPDGTPARAGESFPVTMRIAAVDDGGRVSAPVTRKLVVVAVGAGDVEVTLSMSEATDLDLYVSGPSGATVFFGNTDGFDGGHLDLDANAACSSNLGVNNEHVYFPAGRAPAGTYRVNVGHWESCIDGRRVDYRVTVRACGETVVLTGSFSGRGRPDRCFSADDPSHCQEVVTFDVPPCS